jgi:hypothetical protein
MVDMSLSLWNDRTEMLRCSCVVCRHQSAKECVEERCDCCSVDHAFTLTNAGFEKML